MSSTSGNAVALWIIATITALFFLRAASQLLIPIVLAVLISYILEPVVAWLARHRVHRIAGASVLLLSVFGAIGWGAYTLRDDAAQAIEGLPHAVRRAREMIVSRAGSGPAAPIQQAADELRAGSKTAEQQGGGAGGERQGADQPGGQSDAQKSGVQRQESRPGTGALEGLVQRAVGSAFALAGHITVIVFLVFFLLISGHHGRSRIIEIAGPDVERRRTAATIIDDNNAQIQRFLVVRLVTAGVVAVLTWAVLALMGVAHAAVRGILAGVFNSIPYVGPIIVSW